MNVYEAKTIKNAVSSDRYVGRGIIIGKSADGESIATAYFIMGRSENSRNRLFVNDGGVIKTRAFDEKKLSDPSLVIYSAVRSIQGQTIITNGDQTDTIYEYMSNGGTFEEALRTREFEPDAPNLTPRISGIADGGKSYKLSILKSADEKGSFCNRYFFEYMPISGIGHFIHTYVGDGEILPSFIGEPERVIIPNSIDEFSSEIWDNLDADNKISLFVRYTSIVNGISQEKIINKNK